MKLLEVPKRDADAEGVTPGKKVQTARKFHWPPLSVAELGQLIGVAGATVGNWEAGARPVDDHIPKIAETLGLPIEWFWDGEHSPPPYKYFEPNAELIELREEPQIVLIPFWGTVPCGDWERPNGGDYELMQVSERYKDTPGIIAVKVTGRSMEPRFRHGQIVVIKLSPEPRDGVIVLAESGDRDKTLKVLSFEPDGWKLKSINPAYGEARAEEWTIIGHAIGFEEMDTDGLRP